MVSRNCSTDVFRSESAVARSIVWDSPDQKIDYIRNREIQLLHQSHFVYRVIVEGLHVRVPTPRFDPCYRLIEGNSSVKHSGKFATEIGPRLDAGSLLDIVPLMCRIRKFARDSQEDCPVAGRMYLSDLLDPPQSRVHILKFRSSELWNLSDDLSHLTVLPVVPGLVLPAFGITAWPRLRLRLALVTYSKTGLLGRGLALVRAGRGKQWDSPSKKQSLTWVTPAVPVGVVRTPFAGSGVPVDVVEYLLKSPSWLASCRRPWWVHPLHNLRWRVTS